jgi:hypothetical protein
LRGVPKGIRPNTQYLEAIYVPDPTNKTSFEGSVMLAALTVILFLAFLAFVGTAPQEAIQLFLFLTWSAMGLTVLWTLVDGLLSLL